MSTHHEQAKKLRKLRTRQRVVSLIGIAILVWGIIQVTFLFLDYKNTESSNDAQIEQYISPVNLRASGYIKKIYIGAGANKCFGFYSWCNEKTNIKTCSCG